MVTGSRLQLFKGFHGSPGLAPEILPAHGTLLAIQEPILPRKPALCGKEVVSHMHFSFNAAVFRAWNVKCHYFPFPL
jgi:hypothetical protein